MPDLGVRKDTNPKDAVGVAKAYMSVIPRPVLWEVGLAMLEGSLKYGRHNYRAAGVRASVYYDALSRHLDAFWEGQDIDPESGLHHLSKAIACMVVLRDGIMQDNWVDDRPPAFKDQGWLGRMNARAETLIDLYPIAAAPWTQKRLDDEEGKKNEGVAGTS